MEEGERSEDAKLWTEEKLIKKLIIIILKEDCGRDKKDGEEINITRLY